MISMTYTDDTERGDLPANHLFFLLFDLWSKRHKDSIFLNDFKDLGVEVIVVADLNLSVVVVLNPTLTPTDLLVPIEPIVA